MSNYRVTLSFPFDSALPKDQMVITPHFWGDNPQALANTLKTKLIAFTSVGTKPFKIKVYDADKAPPSYPLAEAEQTGTTPNSPCPRELSLCLSFYSEFNRKRLRGRLYIPLALNGITTTAARPTTTQMTNVLGWADMFKTGLPANHYWNLYSKADKTGRPITDYWCDDEWDIQRKRGLRGTTRQTGKVP